MLGGGVFYVPLNKYRETPELILRVFKQEAFIH